MNIVKSICKPVLPGLAILFLVLPEMAGAEGIKWNGFLNATAEVSDSKAVYLEEIDDNGSFNSSNLGLNAAARVNSKIAVAGQLYATNEGVLFDWGYAQYHFNESLTGKAGKLKYPSALYSEIIDVGATYIWARAPESIYFEGSEITFENYNGGSINYVTGDDTEFSSEFFVGEVNGEDDDHKKMFGVVLKAETDEVTVKLAGNTSTVITAPGFPSAENNKTKTIINFGVEAEYEIATVIFEYVNSSVSGISASDKEGWYITLAHPLDSWTPHFTYQSFETVTGGPEQTSFTLGLNKQLDASVVLKMEYQQVDPTNGGLFDVQPTDSTVNFINLSMNLVF